jgi:hypothetical protein
MGTDFWLSKLREKIIRWPPRTRAASPAGFKRSRQSDAADDFKWLRALIREWSRAGILPAAVAGSGVMVVAHSFHVPGDLLHTLFGNDPRRGIKKLRSILRAFFG